MLGTKADCQRKRAHTRRGGCILNSRIQPACAIRIDKMDGHPAQVFGPAGKRHGGRGVDVQITVGPVADRDRCQLVRNCNLALRCSQLLVERIRKRLVVVLANGGQPDQSLAENAQVRALMGGGCRRRNSRVDV
ncbi:hypothetical protein TOC8171_25990 [Pseudomonas syringae]